jgi:hypothetical protein
MSNAARNARETKGAARRAQRTGEQMTPAARIASLNTAIDARIAATLAGLTDAVDDAAAATAGVSVGAMYRNGSVLMVRVA